MKDSIDATPVDISSLKKEAGETEQKILLRLEGYVKKYNSNSLFSSVYALLLFKWISRNVDRDGELATVVLEWFAFYTYPNFNSEPEEADFRTCDEIVNLLYELLNLRPLSNLNIENKQEDLDEKTGIRDEVKRNILMETELVRSSAYPIQTKEEILEIQGEYSTQFESLIGINPSRAVAILYAIASAHMKVLNDQKPDIQLKAIEIEEDWQRIQRKQAKDRTKQENDFYSLFKNKDYVFEYGFNKGLVDISTQFPVGINDVELEVIPTQREWDALATLIGFSRNSINEMNTRIEVASKPLFIVDENKVLLLDVGNALDALWQSFDSIAKTNQSFGDRYSKTKGDWLESKAKHSVGQLFPNKSVYVGLTYPDPYKEENATTELDMAIRWGPFLLLFELKAKQFRIESQQGDVNKFRNDIKKNVSEAFYQAERATKYIYQTDIAVFKEKESDRLLRIDKTKLEKVFLITISQHYLAGFASQLRQLQPLNLFQNDEYPISMSIACLEMITSVCESPEVFIHYLHKRQLLLSSDKKVLGDELDIFGSYLDTRLQEKEFSGFDVIALPDYRKSFEENLLKANNKLSDMEKFVLDILPTTREVFDYLKSISIKNAFRLLDQTDEVLIVLDHLIKQIRNSNYPPMGMTNELPATVDKTLILVRGSQVLSQIEIAKGLASRLKIEKYKRKVDTVIGIGIDLGQPNLPIESFQISSHAWTFNIELEDVIKSESEKTRGFSQSHGNNKSCPCNSGKKYKHCCMPKEKRGRKNRK